MGRNLQGELMPVSHPPISYLCGQNNLLRRSVYGIIVMLMANLGALVDLVHHPEIDYFDDEHLYVGGINALVMIVLLAALERYLCQLYTAVAKIQRLESFLAVCAGCKKVRVPDPDSKHPEQWLPLDEYLRDHTGTQVSHGICPECNMRLYSGYPVSGSKKRPVTGG